MHYQDSLPMVLRARLCRGASLKRKSVPWTWNQLKKKYPFAVSLSADDKNFSGSTAKDILLYLDGVKELKECVNSVLKMAEDGLSETRGRAMKLKES